MCNTRRKKKERKNNPKMIIQIICNACIATMNEILPSNRSE